MYRIFKIGKISFLLTSIFVLVNAINFATSGLLEPILSSGSLDFFAGSEYWKILTYLLIQSDAGSLFLTLFTFLLISPFLENILTSKYFTKLLFIFALFQGIAVPLFFFLAKQYNVVITGADGLAIFILTLFTLLNPGYSVALGRFRIKTGLLTVTTIMTWLLVKTPAFLVGDWNQIVPVMAFSILGFVAGVTSYVVFKEEDKKEREKYEIDFDDLDFLIPKAEELKPALISQQVRSKQENEVVESHIEFTNDPYEDEQNLNIILDKINDYGKESLTSDEIDFLKIYSDHIS